MIDPVNQQACKQKRLWDDLDITKDGGWIVGVEDAFNGAGSRAKRGEDSQRREHPAQNQPAILFVEEDFAQRIERQRKDDAANPLQRRSRRHPGTIRRAHIVFQRARYENVFIVQEIEGENAHQEIRQRVRHAGFEDETHQIRLIRCVHILIPFPFRIWSLVGEYK